MKRLFLLSLVMILCLPITIYAASIGGADTVGQGMFSISASQDLIFGRDGEYTGGIETSSTETIEMSSDEKINRTMVKGSYGLLEGLDIYALVGTSDFNSNLNWTVSNPGNTFSGKIEPEGDYGFTYGFGMKAKKEFETDWILGCDVCYFRHENDFDGTNSWNINNVPYTESVSGSATFGEWDVAPYVAKRMGDFVPYLGVKYSDVKTKYNLEWEEGDSDICKFSSENNVGMFLGTDWELNDTWSLNLEGEFINEKAVSFALVGKF